MHSVLSCASLVATAILAITLPASIAGAQSSPPTSEEIAAKKLTEEALAAESAKNYGAAISLYKQAYALVPHPVLQFNIGQAYELAGNLPQAEKFYRRYLARDPDGPGASTARKFLASRPAPTQSPMPATSPPLSPAESSPPAHPPASPTTSDKKTIVSSDAARVPKPYFEKLEPKPVTTADDEDVASPTSAFSSEQDDEERRNTRNTGYALMAAGVMIGAISILMVTMDEEFLGVGTGAAAFAAVAGGAAMYAHANNQQRKSAKVAWSPVLGTGFAGVALAGTLP